MWNNAGGGYESYGDQGGGYMDTTAGPGFGTPQMSQDKKQTRSRAQSLLPCTIGQIHAAQMVNDKFMLDNIELHQVTIVGYVRSVKETATWLAYEIDDMTSGPLEVKHFMDNDENTPPEEQTVAMRENSYVRVCGNIRSFNNKRSLVTFRIVQLTDMNELTSHILEVIYSHLHLKKAASGGPNMMETSSHQSSVTTGGSTSFAAGGESNNAVANTGLSNIQQQVAMIIQNCHEDQGISIQEIYDKLRGLSHKSVQDAIEFLSNEGHIYSTIDEEHFRSTDS